MKQEMMGWQWHQLDHMQIIGTSLQTDNHATTSPLSFLQAGAIPATQPIASKPEGTPSSLASLKSRMVYFSGAGIPRLSWKKGH